MLQCCTLRNQVVPLKILSLRSFGRSLEVTAIVTGSSRRFNRYPATYMWEKSWLPFTVILTYPNESLIGKNPPEYQFFSRVATSASQRATREKNWYYLLVTKKVAFPIKIRQNPAKIRLNPRIFLWISSHFDGFQQKKFWLPLRFLKFKLDNLIFGRIS